MGTTAQQLQPARHQKEKLKATPGERHPAARVRFTQKTSKKSELQKIFELKWADISKAKHGLRWRRKILLEMERFHVQFICGFSRNEKWRGFFWPHLTYKTAKFVATNLFSELVHLISDKSSKGSHLSQILPFIYGEYDTKISKTCWNLCTSEKSTSLMKISILSLPLLKTFLSKV